MLASRNIILIVFLCCTAFVSCRPTTTSQTDSKASSTIPTFASWPPGTHAGSRPFVRNNSPARHQFSRVSAPHPVRYGVRSERYELRDGDCGGSDCNAPRQRSEILMGDDSLNPNLNENVWIGWSFYNQSALATPFFQPVFGQWKVNRDENGGHAIIGFKTNMRPSDLRSRRGNDDVFVELDDMRVKGGYGNAARSWGNVCSLFNLANIRGRWTDIVINTNLATNESGYLQIWVNNELKCDYRGQIVASKKIDFDGADHRRGIYWSNTRSWDERNPGRLKPTMVVYYDEYRVGRLREQVDVRLIESSGGPPVD